VNSVKDVRRPFYIAFRAVCWSSSCFLGRAPATRNPAVAFAASLLITFVSGISGLQPPDKFIVMALTRAIGFLVDDAIVIPGKTPGGSWKTGKARWRFAQLGQGNLLTIWRFDRVARRGISSLVS